MKVYYHGNSTDHRLFVTPANTETDPISEWREEDKRNKRFYKLSADGKLILKQLLAEWKNIDASLNGILRG